MLDKKLLELHCVCVVSLFRCKDLHERENEFTKLKSQRIMGTYLHYHDLIDKFNDIVWAVTVVYEDLRKLPKKEYTRKANTYPFAEVLHAAYKQNVSVKDIKHILFGKSLKYQARILNNIMWEHHKELETKYSSRV